MNQSPEALDFVEATFPAALLLPRTAFPIEDIAAEVEQDRKET